MNGAENRLYTPEMLALALRLAEYPLTDGFPLKGSARSPACGSHVGIGILPAPDRSIAGLGLRVQACAVGQAACALFADGAQGASLRHLGNTLSCLEAWLAGSAALPDWPGLSVIEPAQAFPGRHGAILLPWKAAIDALCKPGDNS
jgi:NifU-like protein involved in Fe-S cluster formation